MRVRCVINNLGAIRSSEVRERLRRSINLDGPLTDLRVGQEYPVQALEWRDQGIWLFLHTVGVNKYPDPYPAEMFEFQETALPKGWCLGLDVREGNIVWKRIAFREWAGDDGFYERLVDEENAAVSLYERNAIDIPPP